jgi:hypothetical protein
MTSTLKQFKARALARPEVKKAYDDLAEEFAFLDQVLKASTASWAMNPDGVAINTTDETAKP